MRINWPCKKIVTTSGEAPNGYRAGDIYRDHASRLRLPGDVADSI
jgi:hypothetical protein